eukprot:jgi/Chrzof1/3286/Cz12g19170.t1
MDPILVADACEQGYASSCMHRPAASAVANALPVPHHEQDDPTTVHSAEQPVAEQPADDDDLQPLLQPSSRAAQADGSIHDQRAKYNTAADSRHRSSTSSSSAFGSWPSCDAERFGPSVCVSTVSHMACMACSHGYPHSSMITIM